MTRTFLRVFAGLAAVACGAQTAPPYAWDAGAHPPQTALIQAWRGDTVPLAPRWGGLTNGWTFTAWWSTNGTAWWSKGAGPGVTLAGDPLAWTPDMDCGARKYRLFIRADSAGGASYRANAEVAMLESPGASPNALPLPVRTLDCGAITVLRAPWLLAEEWRSGSNALAEAISAAALTGGGTGAGVTNAPWLTLPDWVSGSNALALAQDGAGITNALAAMHALTSYAATNQTVNLWGTNGTEYAVASGTLYRRSIVPAIDLGTSYTNATRGALPRVTPTYYAAGSSYLSYSSNSVQWLYIHNGEPLAAQTISNNPLPAQLFTDTETLYRVDTQTGSATNWSAVSQWATTQAVSAVDTRLTAATNAIVRTYLLGTNAWITADWSNQTVAVSMLSTNGTNTVLVGGAAANAVDPAATNLLWIALNEGLGDLGSRLGDKADKAWGHYTPDGAANPDPGYMTWLNAPATVFAAGCSWSTYGSYAVLTAPGTVAFASGADGAFRIGPDSTNWFGYVTGGSVLVGAVADSIRTYGAGTEDGTAEIDYAYAGGDFPVLWFTPALSVDFAELSGALWTDNLDGTATVTAPAASGAGFFRATTTATFENVFTSTMPARFAGGVFGATNAAPVVYDSTVRISSGGKTYRIPAQEVAP